MAFWFLIPLFAWRSTIPTPGKWVVTAAAALFVVVAAVSGSGSPETQAAASPASPSQTASPAPTVSPTPAVTVEAPKLLGLSLQDAKAALQKAVSDAGSNATLNVVVISKYSSQPTGTVLSVGPSEYERPGTLVEGDAYGVFQVSLTVAKQPPLVPKVVGEKVDRATKELKALGFDVKTKNQISVLAEGTVLAQSPAAGRRIVPTNVTVTLTVAKPEPGIFIYITGSGSAMVTWLDGNLSSHQITVSLPFKQKVAYGQYGTISMNAQRQSGDSGSITCEIIDYGKVVKKATSSGPCSICSVVY